jgi:adenylate cyclase
MAARSHLPRVDAFRLALLVGLAFTALHALDAFDLVGREVPLVSRLEHAAQDFAVTRLRGPRAASGDVLVVAVDERSIRAEGRWPWSLARMGRLVDGLARAGVAAVGFDVVWAEEDEAGRRLAAVAREARAARQGARDPETLRRLDRVLAAAGDPRSPSGVDPAEQLAGALERAGNAAVGFLFLGPRDAPPESLAAGVEKLRFFRTAPVQVADRSGRLAPAPPEAGGAPRAIGRRFAGALPPIDAVLAVADAGGFLNVLPDPDGTLRRYLAVAQAGGLTFPSLGVAVLAKAAGKDGVAAPVLPVGDGSGDRVAAVRVGPWTVETRPDGSVPLVHLGGYRDFPTLSATDVMGGGLPDGALRGKIAILGNTAAGTWDQRVTPFDDFAPGVLTHATFVENVLHGGLLRRGASVVLAETLAMAALSLGLAFLFSRVGSAAAVPALVLALAAWTGLAVALLRRLDVLAAIGAPLAQIVGMFLAATSYRFLAEERAKRKARETFSRFLAPAMVEEVLAREGPLELGGEKRDLTVLFCDIRGFTTLSERLDPKVLLEFLNEYLTPMTEIIVSEHSGTLDKYIGDAIMAFWGAPKELPDHPLRACRAALAMVRRLADLRPRWREAGLPDIEVGIGINTGPMSVGFVGSQDRFYNYTVLGDAVNLASRLEGANKEYGTRILVSQGTFERVKGSVVARQVDSVRVRGKREPVVVHELVGLAPAAPEEAAFLAEFGRGLEAWKGQRWDEAAARFQAADRLRGGDPCSRVYVARCDAMRLHPPGPGWDGVYEMKTK